MGDSTNLPLEGLRSLVELGGDGACLVEPQGWRVIYANPRLLRLLDWTRELPAVLSIFELIPGLQTPSIQQQLAELAAGERDEARIDCRAASDCSASLVAEVRVRRVDTECGVLLALVFGMTATSANHQATRREGIDSLTGLADRAFTLDQLTKMVRGDRLEDHRCAVLFVDVDGFKQVNDTHGHLVGDGVLCEVARRLAGCVRAGDHVARFGGDEFVVLLERVSGRNEIEPVVRRIEAAFLLPIPVAESEVKLSVSVGIAQAGVDGTSAEELIGAADRAMYAAKRASA